MFTTINPARHSCRGYGAGGPPTQSFGSRPPVPTRYCHLRCVAFSTCSTSTSLSVLPHGTFNSSASFSLSCYEVSLAISLRFHTSHEIVSCGANGRRARNNPKSWQPVEDSGPLPSSPPAATSSPLCTAQRQACKKLPFLVGISFDKAPPKLLSQRTSCH